ncbi:hypothetical protein [Streptomyces caelestis]|uniref:hypothetical protein n=1 Tax=Streptomyces caelestis TaxID=36816 RepID=UPI0036FBA94E
MARVPRVLIAGTALLAGVVLGAPSAASAEQDFPTAFNTREQWLTANPSPVDDKVCIDRRVELASGHYNWEQWLGKAERLNVELGSGWYTWEDCLIPQDEYYVQETSLNPDNPDWVTIRLEDSFRLTQHATYTWGSILDPKF